MATHSNEIYKNIAGDFYDTQAGSFNPLRKWFHVNRYRIVNNLVKSKFKTGMKILDVGCGSCNWNMQKLDVYGIDLNENLLKLAKDKKRLSDYKVADLYDAAIPNESFDIVVASEVIEHIHDYQRAIKEIMRILKPGGYAVISVPFDTFSSFWKYLFFFQCLIQGYIFRNAYYRKQCGHVQHFSKEKLETAFAGQGFNIDTSFVMRRFSIFLAAQKPGPGTQKPLEYEDLTIILPTLNEGSDIKELLDYLILKYRKAAIIVGDDGSKDETKKVALSFTGSNVYFLDRTNYPIHGLAASVIDAIREVKTKYFVVMDADGQHPADKIDELVSQLRLGTNLVIGSRINVIGGWPWGRKVLSYLGTGFGKISLLLRNKLYLSYDILSGFFGADTDYWRKITLENSNKNKFRPRGYKILFDFLKIIPNDTSVAEVYYEFSSYKKLSSKMNFKVVLEYLKACLT